MHKVFFIFSFVLFANVQAQKPLDLGYFLDANTTYNPSIPKPNQIIGHEVGEWHITHDKLMFYMRTLAQMSDRITIEDRGYTYEGRPLLLLTITSPSNHAIIEDIRANHLAVTEGKVDVNPKNVPVVLYQGFSIHGNEPSGSNAALLYAYHLAAAEGEKIENQLKNTVILLDPSFNPDGLQRFAYWANIHKSQQLNPDGNDREYNEVWPGGRTNHYWFDMNRDWLPVQLPESQARIKTFHEWLPNILTDHHEMGTNATFFFQPGEPDRVHPLTPLINQELTKEIGMYHVKALDQIGSLYYSEENFDDYYYGKGSTFPDINGGVGILFEQASSRGHLQESDNGIITFPFTIRNQLVTAFSTLEAANGLRDKLVQYQADYFKLIKNEGEKSDIKAYVFGDEKDRVKTYKLAEILKRHQINFHELTQDISSAQGYFKKGSAYVVPLNQKNPRLIKSMFEKRTTFKDSLFYDISAWTFPLSFNLPYAEVKSLNVAGQKVDEIEEPQGTVTAKSNYAYLFEWHEYYTPRLLNRITEKGIRCKVARTPFTLEGHNYDYGTIMIPVQNQGLNAQELFEFLNDAVSDTGVSIRSVGTGLTAGIDLGSNDFEPVKKQKVALIVGEGIRSYDAGEIWHLFDTRYHTQITKIDTQHLSSTDLSSYTDIIIPNGSSSAINQSYADKIKTWVKNGGTVIGYGNMANWFDKNELMKLNFLKDTTHVAKNIRFDQKQAFEGAQVTGGAIFDTKIDRSHPINFGYTGNRISVFRNNNIYLKPEKNSFDNPIQYTNNPLQSGYISEENEALIKNSVPFKVKRLGGGRVILFTDNTNFRAFWYGTNKLLMNAIFFGDIM